MEDEREEEKLASPYSHPMVAHVAQQNVTLDVNNLIRELELVKRNLWTNWGRIERIVKLSSKLTFNNFNIGKRREDKGDLPPRIPMVVEGEEGTTMMVGKGVTRYQQDNHNH